MNALTGFLAQQERRLRARIERRLTIASDWENAPRLWFASRYLWTLRHAVRWATRRGRWHHDGLVTTMALCLRPGDTFIDIGANVGWVTASASYLVGRSGQVHSFEPSPSTVRYLRRRVRALGLRNVLINEFALGRVPGSATLHEFAENFGGASSLQRSAWPGHSEVAQTAVRVATLDDYVNEKGIKHVEMIKIDVQGAEVDVLQGAQQLLRAERAPVLYVEVERDAQGAFGRTTADVLAAIRRYGYEMYSWRADGLVQVHADEDLPATGHDDAICLKAVIHGDLHRRLVSLSTNQLSRSTP